MILIGGGLFLLYKSSAEIHQTIEGEPEQLETVARSGFMAVILQIMVIDIVFSLDPIITAVGMAQYVEVVMVAVVLSVGPMILFAGAIGRFVSDHPTIKMLALSFLVVVGVVLIVDGFGFHVPKGYIYFAMAFSLGVEMLNIRLRNKREAEAQWAAQQESA